MRLFLVFLAVQFCANLGHIIQDTNGEGRDFKYLAEHIHKSLYADPRTKLFVVGGRANCLLIRDAEIVDLTSEVSNCHNPADYPM